MKVPLENYKNIKKIYEYSLMLFMNFFIFNCIILICFFFIEYLAIQSQRNLKIWKYANIPQTPKRWFPEWKLWWWNSRYHCDNTGNILKIPLHYYNIYLNDFFLIVSWYFIKYRFKWNVARILWWNQI